MQPAIKALLPAELHAYDEASMIGSYACCNPVPEDADIDILFLLKEEDFYSFVQTAVDLDFEPDDAYIGCELNTRMNEENAFASFKKDGCKLNLLVTLDKKFYNNFILATLVCGKLNLKEKSDRLLVHHAILYGKYFAG